MDNEEPEFQYEENLTYQRNENPIDLQNSDAFIQFDQEKVNRRGTREQDLATFICTLGASDELGGCIASAAGCPAGFGIGNTYHRIVTNPIVSIFSFLSLADTYYYCRIPRAFSLRRQQRGDQRL